MNLTIPTHLWAVKGAFSMPVCARKQKNWATWHWPGIFYDYLQTSMHDNLPPSFLKVGWCMRPVKTGNVLTKTQTFVLASWLQVMLPTSVAACSLLRLAPQSLVAAPAIYYCSLTMHYPRLVQWWMALYSTCSNFALYGGRMDNISTNLISLWSK